MIFQSVYVLVGVVLIMVQLVDVVVECVDGTVGLCSVVVVMLLVYVFMGVLR